MESLHVVLWLLVQVTVVTGNASYHGTNLSAIQPLIDAVRISGGGTVFVGGGPYNSCPDAGLLVREGVYLLGISSVPVFIDCQGAGRVFVFPAGSGGARNFQVTRALFPTIEVRADANVVLEEVVFDTTAAVLANGSSSLHFEACHFQTNTGSPGGAVHVEGGAVFFNECSFTENGLLGTTHGGAIACFGCALEVTSCTFDANQALLGSSIYIENTDTASVRLSTFLMAVKTDIVVASSSSVSVVDCVFDGGQASVELQACSGASIEDCAFRNRNTATDCAGGTGVAMFDTTGSTVTRCLFESISCVSNLVSVPNRGAAVLVVSGHSNQIIDCDFLGTSLRAAVMGAGDFGGGGALAVINSPDFTVSSTSIQSSSSQYKGGGMFVYGSNGTIADVVFSENSAGSIREGGCLEIINERDTVAITGSIFRGCSSSSGGGLHAQGATQGRVELYGCTFDSNNAGETGGAIAAYGVIMEIHSCVFTNNQAHYGGAVLVNLANVTIGDGTLIEDNVGRLAGSALHCTMSTMSVLATIQNNKGTMESCSGCSGYACCAGFCDMGSCNRTTYTCKCDEGASGASCSYCSTAPTCVPYLAGTSSTRCPPPCTTSCTSYVQCAYSSPCINGMCGHPVLATISVAATVSNATVTWTQPATSFAREGYEVFAALAPPSAGDAWLAEELLCATLPNVTQCDWTDGSIYPGRTYRFVVYETNEFMRAEIGSEVVEIPTDARLPGPPEEWTVEWNAGVYVETDLVCGNPPDSGIPGDDCGGNVGLPAGSLNTCEENCKTGVLAGGCTVDCQYFVYDAPRCHLYSTCNTSSTEHSGLVAGTVYQLGSFVARARAPLFTGGGGRALDGAGEASILQYQVTLVSEGQMHVLTLNATEEGGLEGVRLPGRPSQTARTTVYASAINMIGMGPNTSTVLCPEGSTKHDVPCEVCRAPPSDNATAPPPPSPPPSPVAAGVELLLNAQLEGRTLWTLSNALATSYSFAPRGQVLQVSGQTSAVGLLQSFNTVPGNEYIVTILSHASSTPTGGQPCNGGAFIGTWDDVYSADLTDVWASACPPALSTWQAFDVLFVAVHTKYKIVLHASDGLNAYFDSASVMWTGNTFTPPAPPPTPAGCLFTVCVPAAYLAGATDNITDKDVGCGKGEVTEYNCTTGTRVCAPCPLGTFSRDPLVGTCDACPGTSESVGADRLSCFCPPASFGSQENCQPCPGGAACDSHGTEVLVPRPGFWSSDGAVFVPCSPPELCPGGSLRVCAEGYTGNACTQCQTQWFREDNACVPCPTGAVGLLVLFIFVIIFIAVLLLVVAQRVRKHIGALSVAVTYFQILALFGSFDLKWPPGASNFLDFLKYANLNIEFFVSPCALPPWVNYTAVWIIQAQIPLFVTVILIGLYWLCRLYNVMLEKNTVPIKMKFPRAFPDDTTGMPLQWKAVRWCVRMRTPIEMDHLKISFINAWFTGLYLGYIAISAVALRNFACRKTAEGWIFLPDETRRCTGSEYTALAVMSAIATLLYVLGIPLIFGAVLFKWNIKVRLGDKATLARFGVLFQRFKSHVYFFELIIMLRKIFIVILSLFLPYAPAVQGVLVMLFLLGSLAVSAFTMPYASDHLNRLDIVLQIATIFLIFLGLMSLAGGNGTAITVVFFLVVIPTLIAILVFMVLDFLERQREEEQECLPPGGHHRSPPETSAPKSSQKMESHGKALPALPPSSGRPGDPPSSVSSAGSASETPRDAPPKSRTSVELAEV